jgi:Kef-type K+ transport system membrane component KefB
MHGPFSDVAFLLLGCALAGAIAVRLRQPVLIAYIVVGIAVGFLIVQDLAVVLAMMTMSALRGAGTGASFVEITGPWRCGSQRRASRWSS